MTWTGLDWVVCSYTYLKILLMNFCCQYCIGILLQVWPFAHFVSLLSSTWTDMIWVWQYSDRTYTLSVVIAQITDIWEVAGSWINPCAIFVGPPVWRAFGSSHAWVSQMKELRRQQRNSLFLRSLSSHSATMLLMRRMRLSARHAHSSSASGLANDPSMIQEVSAGKTTTMPVEFQRCMGYAPCSSLPITSQMKVSQPSWITAPTWSLLTFAIALTSTWATTPCEQNVAGSRCWGHLMTQLMTMTSMCTLPGGSPSPPVLCGIIRCILIRNIPCTRMNGRLRNLMMIIPVLPATRKILTSMTTCFPGAWGRFWNEELHDLINASGIYVWVQLFFSGN